MANKKVKFELTAVDKTKAAFDKVTKGLKGVGGVAKTASKAVAGVGLAAAGAAVALTVLAKKSFEYIDTIGKTASRTGIATETLQAFQLAALESGTTVEQAQKGLEKFARSIGDARRGLKTQQDIFKDLGVAIENTDGSTRAFEDILKDTADAVSRFSNEADRATVLANLFGRAGIQFTEIFADGANGFELFIKRARDLGIILSEKTIRQTEKFNDTIAVIGLQVKNFVNNVFAAFVPVLQVFATNISNILQRSSEAAGGFDALGKVIAISVLENVAHALRALDGFFNLALKGIFKTRDVLKKSGLLPLSEEEEKIASLQKDIDDLLKPRVGLTKGSQLLPISPNDLKLISAMQFEIGELKKITEKPFEKSTFLLDTADSLDALIKDFKDGKLDIDDFYKTLTEGGMGLTDQASPLGRLKAQLEDVQTSLETGVAASMKKFEDTLIEGLKTGKFAFKDFADFVVEQLARIAIQKAIIAPITGGFEDFLSSIFGKKALGGSVNAGKPYMVGESGRELFVPNQSGQIVSNQDLKQMGGGQSAPTVNFNISTVDATGFDELLASRKGLITSIINNAMNNRGRMGVT